MVSALYRDPFVVNVLCSTIAKNPHEETSHFSLLSNMITFTLIFVGSCSTKFFGFLYPIQIRGSIVNENAEHELER